MGHIWWRATKGATHPKNDLEYSILDPLEEYMNNCVFERASRNLQLVGASRCWGVRSVRLDGHRGVSTGRDGDRSWSGRPPRVKLIAVGDAHEVVIPRGLKVQAPEPDFLSGRERVRGAHGIPLAPVLGANHHRDGPWRLIFSARPLPGAPTVGAESSPDTN
jgi:hypothetical protein